MRTWEVWRALKKVELLWPVPRATLTLLSCSPNLPEDIKSANSIDDFKRRLKTFLFKCAYES